MVGDSSENNAVEHRHVTYHQCLNNHNVAGVMNFESVNTLKDCDEIGANCIKSLDIDVVIRRYKPKRSFKLITDEAP